MITGARQTRSRAAFALAWLLLLGVAAADTPPSGVQAIPPLTARVTDLTGTLTAEQRSALEQKLAAFEASKGSQLAVLIVPTTQPEEIEQYSIRVVEQWKLGRGAAGGQKVDDGALLLVAKNDHRMRIEVGYGLEGVLTDAMSNRIISETIAPAFRQGDFYGGIDAGLGQMMRLIQGEPFPPPRPGGQSGQHRDGSNLLVLLFFAILIGSSVLRAIFGRTVGSVLTAGMAGALVWIAIHVLLIAGLAAIVAFILAMVAGVARGSGWSSYPRVGGFGGGWGGFGGGTSGGGGGFSGGGGGFGGGGASGSW